MKKLTESQHFAFQLQGKWLWFKLEGKKAWMFDWDIPIEITPLFFWACFHSHYRT
jgi:hypothetical protein